MGTKTSTEEKGKSQTVRKILIALTVLIVLVALVLAARFLVSSVDILELLKKLHGG
jgi:hypothetical protein